MSTNEGGKGHVENKSSPPTDASNSLLSKLVEGAHC